MPKSKSKSKSKSKCGKGQIMRKAYSRKGYSRKAYVKKSGSKVRGSYVDRAKVGASCITDRGKPGKGPKTLPEIGEARLLRRYGYKLHNAAQKRQSAIKEAMEKENALKVYRHLVLIRNYTEEGPNKRVLARDIAFAKKLYQKSKSKSSVRSKSKSKPKSKSRSRKPKRSSKARRTSRTSRAKKSKSSKSKSKRSKRSSRK